MHIRLRYFASVREAIGRADEAIDTDAATLGALRDELIARGMPYVDALARGKAVRLALDQLMVNETTALCEGGEVAFFPPVTGG